MRIAEELGVDANIVIYRKEPPDADTLREIIAKLEDPPTDLVRRDSLFKKLELSDELRHSTQDHWHARAEMVGELRQLRAKSCGSFKLRARANAS